MRCTYCGSSFHTVVHCPHTWGGQERRARLKCSYCGSNKHSVEACPKTWAGNAARAWNEDSVKDEFVKD